MCIQKANSPPLYICVLIMTMPVFCLKPMHIVYISKESAPGVEKIQIFLIRRIQCIYLYIHHTEVNLTVTTPCIIFVTLSYVKLYMTPPYDAYGFF